MLCIHIQDGNAVAIVGKFNGGRKTDTRNAATYDRNFIDHS